MNTYIHACIHTYKYIHTNKHAYTFASNSYINAHTYQATSVGGYLAVAPGTILLLRATPAYYLSSARITAVVNMQG